MTAPFAPPAPQQGPPTGPQAQQIPFAGPPQQVPFVQQQAPQGPPQGYWTNAPQRAFVLSPLYWLAIVLLPVGLLTVIIVSAVDDSYSKAGPIFTVIGIYAAFIGGLALVGGLIVSALKRN